MRVVLITLIFINAFALMGYGQVYADKSFYLVDNLELEKLSEKDRILVDSCLNYYHKAAHDTDKIVALNEICISMMHESWNKFQFFNYDLIKRLLDKKPADQVQSFLLGALQGALNNIGYIHMHQGNTTKALEYYHECLKIQAQIGNINNRASTLNNIGTIYLNQIDFTEALNYFEIGLKIREEIGDKHGIAESLNNIGYVFNEQGDFLKALEYYLKALKIQEEINDVNGQAIALGNIGIIYKRQKMFPKALEYYTKSLKKMEEIGDRAGISTTLNNIGVIHYMRGRFNKAKIYGENSLKLGREIGFPDNILIASNLLRKVYRKQSNWKAAYSMFELYNIMRDSLDNLESKRAAIKQDLKYTYEKQAVADSIKAAEVKKVDEAQMKAQEAALAHEKTKSYVLYGGVGILLLLGGFMFNRYRIIRKQKMTIESQKNEVEKQRELAEAQTKIAENQKVLVEVKNKEILDSINYAKRIQNAILPPPRIVNEYLGESFILYKPKDVVAGDFYWLEYVNDTVLFAAADCTGHGVPGALVSVICNNALNRAVREYHLSDPGQLLDKVREIVIQQFEKSEEDVKDGMDIALCSLAITDPNSNKARQLQYAGANNPLWIVRNSEILETKANKQPIGKFDNLNPYTTHSIDLLKGDSVYIFSDGYVDQFGGQRGKKFKSKALKELLISIQLQPMDKQKSLLDKAFENWKGALEQIDDVCIIGVKI